MESRLEFSTPKRDNSRKTVINQFQRALSSVCNSLRYSTNRSIRPGDTNSHRDLHSRIHRTMICVRRNEFNVCWKHGPAFEPNKHFCSPRRRASQVFSVTESGPRHIHFAKEKPVGHVRTERYRPFSIQNQSPRPENASNTS